MIKNFYDLEVWKNAHKLALEIYKLTEKFPKKETYGITNQIRRSSSSVSANIAEGFGRYHYKDKIKFFYNSRGSSYETQNFLLLANGLEYITIDESNNLLSRYKQLNKSLNALINTTGKQIQSPITNS